MVARSGQSYNSAGTPGRAHQDLARTTVAVTPGPIISRAHVTAPLAAADAR